MAMTSNGGGGLANSTGTATSLAPNATGSTLVLSGSSTALQFISTQTAGSDGYKVNTNGARWHFGTGANDYASSDGTVVTFAGNVTTGPFVGQSAANSAQVSMKDTTNSLTYSWIINNTTVTLYNNAVAAMVAFTDAGNMTLAGSVTLSSYTDDSATTGNRTVNKVRGKNAFAIGASTITITNSFVTANSQIICTLEFGDATLTQILRCIPGAGSFTATGNANATAATKFSWWVLN